MTYEDFYRLKVDAMGFGSLDDFLAECGGSVDKEDLWAFPAILEYSRHPSAVILKLMSGSSRAEFSRNYRIPLRTVEEWEAGRRDPPEYLLDLLAFAVISDLKV